MKLTILRNDPQVPAGHLERVARARGVDVEIVKLDEGAAFPSMYEVEAVAVLGGEMGAYDGHRFPYLETEKRFLSDAVATGIPVLGVCLGCQLLAYALGGRAYLGERPEVRFGSLESTERDPVVDHLTPGPVLTFHRDTWDVPDGGRLVARSDRYPQAFRFGTALGVQPHPEVDAQIVTSWLEHEDGVRLAVSAGADPVEVLGAFASKEAEVAAVADRFFGAWLDEAEDMLGTTHG